jgi:S-adenosylmethionine decarboxylase
MTGQTPSFQFFPPYGGQKFSLKVKVEIFLIPKKNSILIMKNTMKNFVFCCFLCLCSSLAAAESYEFIGRHMIAEYYGCEKEAIYNNKKLKKVMIAAAKASGATLLKSVEYRFLPHGYSFVILLSESHASIHTYPELRACFVDLFTCGTRCDSSKFENVLRAYLRPERAKSKVIERK